MFPEDLLFWIAPMDDAPVVDHNVLCQRHADAMVVPRGWTLDDRREPIPRLFTPRRADTAARSAAPTSAPASRRRSKPAPVDVGEQLQIDGTGEIPRPDTTSSEPEVTASWRPDFDDADDLDGLLEVRSPLLARAFRGTGRPRT
jgi:hypothetical protein